MLVLGFVLVLLFWVYDAHRISKRTRLRQWSSTEVWRLAWIIAGLRIAALWFGTIGLRRPDWLQVPAYLALMFDWPELYFIRGARMAPYRWAILGSLILVATSYLWAAAFAWFGNRLRGTDTRPRDLNRSI